MLGFLLTGSVFLFAGFIQGYTGFGAALVAIPLLSFYLDVKIAVPLCVLAGLVITLTMALNLRHKLDPSKLGPLFLGALPGIALGAYLLQDLPSQVLRLALGVLLVTYAAFGLLTRIRGRRLHVFWALLAGFASGILATTLSAIGPPTIVYASLTRWTRDEIKATLSGFFLAGTAVTAVAHLATGLTTAPVLWHFVAALPGVVVGVSLGIMLSRRASERDYRKLVLGLLGVMGVMMLVL